MPQADQAAPADDSLPPEIRRDIAAISQRQSRGLKGAKTIVHRAFDFSEKSVYKPTEDGKLVAVDVEFRGYGEGLDLDDVDVLDGETNENFGSNPEIKFLYADGTLSPDEPEFEDMSQPIRALLIYAVPRTVKSIRLEYWGDCIASQATPITAGSLRYDESQLIAGAQFWPYPQSMHFFDTWRRGRWLLPQLSEGAAVVDLGVWPPTIDFWDCNLLRGIEPAPHGGWVMLTKTGRTSDDIRFPIWLDPADRPGSSPIAAAANGPRGHLHGIGVVGGRIFGHDQHFLYWYGDARLERDDTLGEARGVTDKLDTYYTHGTVTLANGRTLLLWDGDGYEVANGQPKKVWPLRINEPYEFMTVPWGDDGFYFLEKRKVYRVKPGTEREQVMSVVENIMGIGGGPDGSILFNLGTSQNGMLVGLWFPAGDSYLPIRVREISAQSSSSEIGGLYWSEDTQRFYVVARTGVFTFPSEPILARSRVKLPPQAK